MANVSGGDKFSAYLKAIAERLSKAKIVDVGWPSGDTYPDGTSIPMVAAIQEFGAPSKGIPPRPYFRTMISQHSQEWPEAIAESLKATNYDSERTLDQLGDGIESQLRDSIVAMNSPPLSPVTVMLRGMRTQKRFRDLPFWDRFAIAKARVENNQTNYGASTKPLIDTGVLLGAIKHKVK